MAVQFFETMMGRQFYESTLPKVASELKRLADGVAVLNGKLTALTASLADKDAERHCLRDKLATFKDGDTENRRTKT